MKKGQISTEVMYSVGVMLLIFLMLLGISFDQRADVRHLGDIIERRNECYRLASTISEVAIATYYTEVPFALKYSTNVFPVGVIEVQGVAGRRVTTSASCTFHAYIYNIGASTPECIGSGQGVVHIKNHKGNVTIEPEVPQACFT